MFSSLMASPKQKAAIALSQDVDRLGKLKAEISDLEKQVAEIRSRLVASGVDEADGKLFHMKISKFTKRNVDWRSIAAVFEPEQKLIDDNTSETEVQRLTVSARH